MSQSTPYIVSARKYRPATFKTVVGQSALTNTLKNAIDTKRLAQAYLFCGPRGVGKTSCARIFAKTINCEHPTPDGEACGQCDSCRAIDEGNSFNIIELDAASNNSVDDIRNITEQVKVAPRTGSYRVFIIDEVHMLSSQAFNAFLKTLEEPPKYAIFILATTEKHKVIPTILSRCQIYDFKRITIQDIIEHLAYVAEQEHIHAETAALNVIAQKADGAMRDALSIFDQVSASCMGDITYEKAIANLNVLDYDYYFRLVKSFMAGNVAESLLLYKEIRDKGFDSLFFVNGLASHVRNIMVAVDPSTLPLLEVGDEVAAKYQAQAKEVPLAWNYTALKILSDTDLNYRTSSNKQLLVELALIRLCQLLHPTSITENGAAPVKQPTVTQPAAPAAPAPTHATPPPTAATPAAPAPPTPPAAAAPQPAAPSVATAPPAAAAAGRGTVRPRARKAQSFRLTEDETPSSSDEPHPAAVSEPEQETPSTFTAEQLAQVWQEYISRHADQHIMITAMQGYLPKVPENGQPLEILVDTPAQQEAIEANLQDLANFLRTSLHNQALSLTVKINENDGERRNKYLTQDQFLKKILDSNPVIASLLGTIEAELA